MPPTEGRADGLLLVDKEPGPTSHDVVQTARRALGTRRVGHTGTLDPFADGLLLLCVGRATRLVEYFHVLDKSYRAVLRLGVETATHDPTGETIRTSDAWREVRDADLRAALPGFTGELLQRPPAFSAKRVDGERAYQAARRGEQVDLDAERVTVHDLRLTGWDPPDAELECRVSTGTYVRALARDLGRELGCGAHLRALRRAAIGPFRVEEAVRHADLRSGEGIPDRAWRTPAEAVGWLPRRELDGRERERVSHGSPVPLSGPGGPDERGNGTPEPPAEGAPVALVHGGSLIAVAEARRDRLHPRKVLHAR